MLVAVCFSGDVRSFGENLKSVKEQFGKQVGNTYHYFGVFSKTESGENVDLFIDAMDPKKTYILTDTDIEFVYSLSREWDDAIPLVIKEPDFSASQGVSYENDVLMQESEEYKNRPTGKFVAFSFVSQHFKINKCYELMDEYSKTNKITYDMVARMRYDCYVFRNNRERNLVYFEDDPRPSPEQSRDENTFMDSRGLGNRIFLPCIGRYDMHIGLDDTFAYGPPDVMKIYSGLVKNTSLLNGLKAYPYVSTNGAYEFVLAKHMRMNGVELVCNEIGQKEPMYVWNISINRGKGNIHGAPIPPLNFSNIELATFKWSMMLDTEGCSFISNIDSKAFTKRTIDVYFDSPIPELKGSSFVFSKVHISEGVVWCLGTNVKWTSNLPTWTKKSFFKLSAKNPTECLDIDKIVNMYMFIE
jgi:hypothetical protein